MIKWLYGFYVSEVYSSFSRISHSRQFLLSVIIFLPCYRLIASWSSVSQRARVLNVAQRDVGYREQAVSAESAQVKWAWRRPRRPMTRRCRHVTSLRVFHAAPLRRAGRLYCARSYTPHPLPDKRSSS